uniref:NADH-ubiquinone oxidoreductase chain 6 n=1 Tax=Fissurella volcano TaxID=707972 RepID=H6V538_FISVO|nr:NADH dehydrogenase subunit 6 [Fissurella volcano]AFB78090.1 NADH dehydrogenase subunit 6 [Fissurella volcano]
MSVVLISSFCFCGVFMLPLVSTPISLGLAVVFFSVGLCLLVGVFFSSWYGYILFLIYIGGLLVMFMYVSAISPNVVFSWGDVFSVVMFGLCGGVVYYYMSGGSVSGKAGVGLENDVGLFISDLVSGSSLAGPSTVCLMVVLGVILLINLIAVVKVCSSRRGGALRRYGGG